MKRMILAVVSALIVGQLWSQEESGKDAVTPITGIPLIGDEAPHFTAESTRGTINFPADFGHKWKILFSHPQDFTPVCSSEIIELAYLKKEFDELGVKLAVVSTDELSMHEQWKKAMESLSIDNRGKVKIDFPIIEDANRVIAREYGMLHPKTGSNRSVRGVFIIDPDDVIQAIYFYPVNVGRSTDEILRTVSALQATRHQLAATPVNWHSGQDLMVTYHPRENGALTLDKPPEGYYQKAWFMWYKKAYDENSGTR
jgi:peroxiredoxin 2/4